MSRAPPPTAGSTGPTPSPPKPRRTPPQRPLQIPQRPPKPPRRTTANFTDNSSAHSPIHAHLGPKERSFPTKSGWAKFAMAQDCNLLYKGRIVYLVISSIIKYVGTLQGGIMSTVVMEPISSKLRSDEKSVSRRSSPPATASAPRQAMRSACSSARSTSAAAFLSIPPILTGSTTIHFRPCTIPHWDATSPAPSTQPTICGRQS